MSMYDGLNDNDTGRVLKNLRHASFVLQK